MKGEIVELVGPRRDLKTKGKKVYAKRQGEMSNPRRSYIQSEENLSSPVILPNASQNTSMDADTSHETLTLETENILLRPTAVD